MAFESELAPIELPAFGMPTAEPAIPVEVYRQRVARLRDRAAERGLDAFVVYGDREHFANLAYFTGYDPRFEEALAVIDVADGDTAPTLVVGNEGREYADDSPYRSELTVSLYQPFSLLGQDRSRETDLSAILREAGVNRGDRVGVAGWKHFPEAAEPRSKLEIPAYIVETLRERAGETNVENTNDLLMDSAGGMRTINEVEQLAAFEFAACHTSQAIRSVLFEVEPGMTEFEAVERMELSGLPMSCHIMLSSGPRARMGLPSPTGRTIERGDPLTAAYGTWGSLNSRAGYVVDGPGELPEAVSDYVDRVVAPYFETVAAWYETVAIGVEAGELYETVQRHVDPTSFELALNPGHLVHLDEWVDSPVYEGSSEPFRSGMAIQVDLIPTPPEDYFRTNIEDTIALADEALRERFAEAYPAAWERVQRRRSFVQETIGIDLAPEILPFSNIPAYLPPYLLSPDRAMRLR